MELHTERLVLRPWHENDAEALYEYAKDPRIGSAAGWQSHTSVEDSLEIIRTVLSAPEIYAVVPKGTDKPVGCIGLMLGDKGHAKMGPGEAEIGYWIGAPFWGKGYTPEAVKKLLRYGFETLKLKAVWGGYYDGNDKSRRVLEKCGFVFRCTEHDRPVPLLNETRTQHFTRITKTQWENSR